MTEAKILSLKGRSKGKVELPSVFEATFRPDLIKRAVLSEQSKKRQPQGRSPTAGKMVAHSSVGPGRGISKVPRTHGKRTHHGHRGTFINQTVGGMLAHPPKVEKVYIEKINKKEHRLALWSAVSATGDKDIVEKRGHIFDEKLSFPLVVSDDIEGTTKTNEMVEILSNLGLSDDLERTKQKKVRAGKGKMRGRKYRRKVGPLVVVADDCDALRAGKNVAGVTVCKVKDLTVEELAPGSNAGRLTVWTESAIKAVSEWK